MLSRAYPGTKQGITTICCGAGKGREVRHLEGAHAMMSPGRDREAFFAPKTMTCRARGVLQW